MLEFSAFKLELEELSHIAGEFINDVVLKSFVVEFPNILFWPIAAIGALLTVRETIQAAVALWLRRYALEVDVYGLQPRTDLDLKGIALQLSY
jgi:hypothetical protein